MGLRRASPEDLGALVAVLADGFAADPVFRWMFAGERFDELLRGWLALVVGVAVERGPAYLGDGDAGAALWTDPGVPLAGEEELARVEEFLTAELAQRGGDVLAALGSVGVHKPAEPPSRQLVYIAVRPAARGRGLGGALIAPLLAECDRDATPAYLHSTNPATQPFYETLGFAAIVSVEMPDGGPTITPMWREPR